MNFNFLQREFLFSARRTIQSAKDIYNQNIKSDSIPEHRVYLNSIGTTEMTIV